MVLKFWISFVVWSVEGWLTQQSSLQTPIANQHPDTISIPAASPCLHLWDSWSCSVHEACHESAPSSSGISEGVIQRIVITDSDQECVLDTNNKRLEHNIALLYILCWHLHWATEENTKTSHGIPDFVVNPEYKNVNTSIDLMWSHIWSLKCSELKLMILHLTRHYFTANFMDQYLHFPVSLAPWYFAPSFCLYVCCRRSGNSWKLKITIELLVAVFLYQWPLQTYIMNSPISADEPCTILNMHVKWQSTRWCI